MLFTMVKYYQRRRNVLQNIHVRSVSTTRHSDHSRYNYIQIWIYTHLLELQFSKSSTNIIFITRLKIHDLGSHKSKGLFVSNKFGKQISPHDFRITKLNFNDLIIYLHVLRFVRGTNTVFHKVFS